MLLRLFVRFFGTGDVATVENTCSHVLGFAEHTDDVLQKVGEKYKKKKELLKKFSAAVAAAQAASGSSVTWYDSDDEEVEQPRVISQSAVPKPSTSHPAAIHAGNLKPSLAPGGTSPVAFAPASSSLSSQFTSWMHQFK